jgi:precorrin-2 dehydrogenase/sirohydrochlorin ferrochelatase
MGYLVNLAVEGRRALVVGAGAIAHRKIEDLLAARAAVAVVAPEACEPVRALAVAGRIAARWKRYETTDLEGAFLAIGATDDEELNARVSRDAQASGILVNIVDRPALCTFTLPAVVRRGDFLIGVATEGRSPALASVLREDLERQFGPEYAAMVELLGDLRGEMIAQGWDGPRIRQAVSELYRAGLAAAVARGDRAQVDDLIRRHFHRRSVEE